MTIDPLYQKLLEQIKVQGEQYAAQAMKAVFANQAGHLDELEKYIGLLYMRRSVDGMLNVTASEKNTILADLDKQLAAAAHDMSSTETQTVSQVLEHNYTDTYYKNAFVMDTGLKSGIRFGLLKPEYIDAAVNSPLDGKLFSDRIWQNKVGVAAKVRQSISDALNGDVTIDQIARQIRSTYNVSAYESQRLVNTENARVQSQAIDDIGQAAGCSQQMYTATLEANTCAECAALDGNMYDIDDDSKPDIPLHPLCRCVYINVPPVPGWTPTQRRDNETGKDIGYTNYTDWLANKGIQTDANFQSALVGLTTANDLKITALSEHFGQRMAEREIEPEDAADALTNPLKTDTIKTDDQGRHSQRFTGEGATININPDTGVAVTGWKTSSRRVKKLKGGK